jgi:hypothetical protein
MAMRSPDPAIDGYGNETPGWAQYVSRTVVTPAIDPVATTLSNP